MPTITEKDLLLRNPTDTYSKFKNAKVCILGLGGIGSNVAMSLARAGIGQLKLIDFDTVEASNLNRQQYRICHIGMAKTLALQDMIKEVNPFVLLEVETRKITEHNILSLIKEYPIIVEGFDRAETKASIINMILSHCPTKTIVSGSGMAGLGNADTIKCHRKLNHLYICGDEMSDFEDCNGLISARVSICANLQALTVLRLLAEEK